MANNPSTIEPKRRGRRAGDPAAMRSERLVLRVHPHLLDALNVAADEAGLSRSTYVERCLISWLNEDPRNSLDAVGRRVSPEQLSQRDSPLGSMASFERKWQNFKRMRRTVLMEEVPGPDPVDLDLDNRGRNDYGGPVRPQPGQLRPANFGNPQKPRRRK